MVTLVTGTLLGFKRMQDPRIRACAVAFSPLRSKSHAGMAVLFTSHISV